MKQTISEGYVRLDYTAWDGSTKGKETSQEVVHALKIERIYLSSTDSTENSLLKYIPTIIALLFP